MKTTHANQNLTISVSIQTTDTQTIGHIRMDDANYSLPCGLDGIPKKQYAIYPNDDLPNYVHEIITDRVYIGETRHGELKRRAYQNKQPGLTHSQNLKANGVDESQLGKAKNRLNAIQTAGKFSLSDHGINELAKNGSLFYMSEQAERQYKENQNAKSYVRKYLDAINNGSPFGIHNLFAFFTETANEAAVAELTKLGALTICPTACYNFGFEHFNNHHIEEALSAYKRSAVSAERLLGVGSILRLSKFNLLDDEKLLIPRITQFSSPDSTDRVMHSFLYGMREYVRIHSADNYQQLIDYNDIDNYLGINNDLTQFQRWLYLLSFVDQECADLAAEPTIFQSR